MAYSSYTQPGIPPANSKSTGGSQPTFNSGVPVVIDELGRLHQLSLSPSSGGQEIVFPGIVFGEQNTNSLVRHTYPNLPNARVENMGQDASHYTIRAVLTNNIYPDARLGETWVAGTLFPSQTNSQSVFQQLRNLLESPGNKIFTHPVDGSVVVQVASWSYTLDAKGPRDGAYFDIRLVTTIPDSNSLSNTLPANLGSGVSQAARKCDAAFADFAIADYNPPGLNLNGFFTMMAANILYGVSAPYLPIPSLNFGISDFISINQTLAQTAIETALPVVGAALINSPSYLTNNTVALIVASSIILGSPLLGLGLTYTGSLYFAMQSVSALNATPSNNVSQFLQKVRRTLQDLTRYYIDQNNSACSPMIDALRQMSYRVLNQANSQNSNSNQSQRLGVSSYLTKSQMSWMQLANLLKQDVDDLLNLNQKLVKSPSVSGNTTIFYYRAN